MRIGIVTFWWTQDNYGQVLQCYALQHFLRTLGHEPFLIKVRPNEYAVAIERKKIRRYLSIFNLPKVWSYVNKGIKFRLNNKLNAKHSRGFDSFRENYLMMTDQIYGYEDLLSRPPQADIYITGSDQVWCSPSPVYYLAFGTSEVKRVSYAASFGKEELTDNYIKSVAGWLKQFDCVTVREKSAIHLCEQMGRNDALCVPDPTFLLNEKDYLPLLSQEKNDGEKYLLLYLIGNKIDVKVQEVFAFAQKMGLKVVYIASQGRIDGYSKTYPSVEGWLSLMKNAEYVVTNSFHGSVFSVIFRKQFLTLPLTGEDKRMNTRIETLYSEFNLPNRIFQGDWNLLSDRICYDGLDAQLQKKKEYVGTIFNSFG